jgi:hypothetical protein
MLKVATFNKSLSARRSAETLMPRISHLHATVPFWHTHPFKIFNKACRASIQGYHMETECRKEKCMLTNSDNRVLGRRKARQLSPEEFDKILQGTTQMTQLPSIPFHPDF